MFISIALNNNKQDILSDNPIMVEQSLPLNSQSTTCTNTCQLPVTTNNFDGTIKLSKLELLNQPARLRRNRTLKDLRDNECPAIQVEGAKQGTSLQFKVNSKYFSNHLST